MSPIQDTGHPAARRLLLISLAATIVLGSPGLAQTPPGPSGPSPSQSSRGPSDEREVEAFLDGYLGHQLGYYNLLGFQF